MNSEKWVVGGAITALAILAWVLTFLVAGPAMGMPTFPLDPTAVTVFLATWTVGMVAMMFPTTVPMLLLFFHAGRNASEEVRAGGGPTPVKAFIFVVTYLGLWVGAGLAFYLAVALALSQVAMEANLFLGTALGLGIALILVAAYQLSPIKGECLSRCHPTSFLYRYYRGGLSGSVRMGISYAQYCIGCCWVMMAFLMAAASMGVAWMAVFAGIIFVERTFPMRKWMPRLVGLGFLVGGAALILLG